MRWCKPTWHAIRPFNAAAAGVAIGMLLDHSYRR
jgi:hypothetical protein